VVATSCDAAAVRLSLYLGASLRNAKLPSAAIGSSPSSAESKLPCLMAVLEDRPLDLLRIRLHKLYLPSGSWACPLLGLARLLWEEDGGRPSFPLKVSHRHHLHYEAADDMQSEL
jgi:hypothetical protein